MKSLGYWFLVGSLFFAVLACGAKANQANYDKIQKDMTQEEVQRILGPPTETTSVSVLGLSGTSSTWRSSEGTITVQYLNGKVQIKQFTKP